MSTHDVSEQPHLLFDAPPSPVAPEKGNEAVARNFVRWCCSFGPNFRNSPDIGNLQYWVKKNKLKLKSPDERTVLALARHSFFKQIEKSTRKPEN